MYYNIRVKVVPVNAKNPLQQYKANFINGEFISKGKQTKKAKVEEQVKTYLSEHLKKSEPSFNYNIDVLKVERNDKRFVVVEDKFD